MNRRKLLKAARNAAAIKRLSRFRQRTRNSRRCTIRRSHFRNEQYQWHQVCEATYDNYMIRRIRA